MTWRSHRTTGFWPARVGTGRPSTIDGSIKVWELNQYQEVLTLQGHDQPVQIGFLARRQTLVSFSKDVLRLWPVPSLETSNAQPPPSTPWLKLRLIGTVSNRAAIGAKVRLKARIGGGDFWQLREISGGTGGAQDDPRPNFGLGDATVAETVRIEWPSGAVQEFQNVPANQILTVTESSRLEPHVKLANGRVELKVRSWKGFAYDIEASRDLMSWTRLTTLTNETGTLSFADPGAGDMAQGFYRAIGK